MLQEKQIQFLEGMIKQHPDYTDDLLGFLKKQGHACILKYKNGRYDVEVEKLTDEELGRYNSIADGKFVKFIKDYANFDKTDLTDLEDYLKRN